MRRRDEHAQQVVPVDVVGEHHHGEDDEEAEHVSPRAPHCHGEAVHVRQLAQLKAMRYPTTFLRTPRLVWKTYWKRFKRWK